MTRKTPRHEVEQEEWKRGAVLAVDSSLRNPIWGVHAFLRNCCLGGGRGRGRKERIFIVIRLQCKHAKFRGRRRRDRRLTISVCKSTVFIVDGVGLNIGKRRRRTNERTKGLNFIPEESADPSRRRFDYIVTWNLGFWGISRKLSYFRG